MEPTAEITKTYPSGPKNIRSGCRHGIEGIEQRPRLTATHLAQDDSDFGLPFDFAGLALHYKQTLLGRQDVEDAILSDNRALLILDNGGAEA
jgi:hypothetical protein